MMLALRRRSGERVYLFSDKLSSPIHITPILLSDNKNHHTEITLNIEAPEEVRIKREEQLKWCGQAEQETILMKNEREPIERFEDGSEMKTHPLLYEEMLCLRREMRTLYQMLHETQEACALLRDQLARQAPTAGQSTV